LFGGIAWLGYGRLRPLHTNAVNFAFGGSALIAPKLAAFTFWCSTEPTSWLPGSRCSGACSCTARR